ncbi:MAG TPA: hypothetical protein VFB69_05380 [Candidatus Dormibacteraeota bacterium]|nr:hypothetical protein [Candidatus Dormibacteraeota bacterium]
MHATPLYEIEFGDQYPTLATAGGGILTQQASTASIQRDSAVPAGNLAYTQVVANQAGITTLVDATGLALTVTAASGRRLRIEAQLQLLSSVAGDIIQAQLVEDGTTVLQVVQLVASTSGQNVNPIAIRQPSAGVHTYKVQIQRAGGTGNVTSIAGGTDPAFIMVEDVGV